MSDSLLARAQAAIDESLRLLDERRTFARQHVELQEQLRFLMIEAMTHRTGNAATRSD
jgi:hypothetical protein